MRYLLVGLGNLGAKRKAVLGDRCVATVDPFNAAADYCVPGECPDERYDAAILAVPNDVKVDLLAYFLDRGKHVLVEKPLILDRESADELRRAGAKTGTIWYTSYNFRFEPHVLAIQRHLETGILGRLYRVRMFYGNGTAAAIAGTWRDSAYGVLEDMASHLIDLTGFVFGHQFVCDFTVWARDRHEALKGPDHCILATTHGSVVLEASFVSWKNRWRIEVTGSDGSLEMDGLTKWGSSTLRLWRRGAHGAPEEIFDVVCGPDPTWAADLQHFENRVARGEGSCDNDLWISRTVMAASRD